MASPNGTDGPGFREFHMASVDQIMDPSAWIEFGGWLPGAWTGNFDSLDGAILIEGDAVVSTESASFGDVKSLFR